ncbi:uncharacterized protein LOC131955833 [Physella acuta]|uniref:uncharacterized protein LOC131955833 n=1 Tax=Physella acuta TaxID=109671 RepID=UPI0027DB8CB5|nr:uncharacterized protein LOC131955833 [Physella acuta]
MNSTEWISNSTTAVLLSPVLIPLDDNVHEKQLLDTTGATMVDISDKPCGEALSSQTPAAVKLPGSLDALLYIVIVLMFYAFSIVVLMVKYIRREREEANLRNYYNEFVSRDKFRSAQYKNRQFMRRIFGRRNSGDDPGLSAIEEETGGVATTTTSDVRYKPKNHSQTITRNGNTFSRLVVEGEEDRKTKESFTFLSAKNQFCKRGFFGKKFCNKQLCSKCVSEGAPTIDWGDGRHDQTCTDHGVASETVEIRLFNNPNSHTTTNTYQRSSRDIDIENNYLFERANSIFFPIMECDSEKDSDEIAKSQAVFVEGRINDNVLYRGPLASQPEEQAIVSSCSLEVSELLANMPPLGAMSNSNDMDTLDGLSNLDSEAESQSLLNYSTSIRGTNNIFSSQNEDDNPRAKNHSASEKHEQSCEGERGHKDLSDFLSERTSLLSCTLSIANEAEDDDAITNLSSSKHGHNGLSHSHSNSNGKVIEDFKTNGKLKEEYKTNGKLKEEFKSNGKSILNSISKTVSSDEEEMMKLLSNITMLTEESGVFKNLKYFLRSFSKHEETDQAHEKSNLLPKETYFGPGSPKSIFSAPQASALNAQCDSENRNTDYGEMDSIDDDLLNMEDCQNYGNRWGYTYDEEDEVYSEGGKSSSFGEYCMGETSDSQVIDLSKPLVRRQFDSETKNGLSRAFIGLEDPWLEDIPPINKPNPMVAGYGNARKETKV